MEMAKTLDRFLDVFYRLETGENFPGAEQDVERTWGEFSRDRMEKLIGCL